jgi:quercetin dioxygenase-like cupin family protein
MKRTEEACPDIIRFYRFDGMKEVFMIKPGKWFSGILLVLLVGFAPALFAAEEAAKPKPKAHAAAMPVVWPADQLKWVDAPGAPAGVKMAVLWGDPAKGALGAIDKFPAGFKAELHTHSSDLHNVVLSGTLIHSPEGGPEVKLGPGSYLFLPHTYKHTTACDAASECTLFVQAAGKFDIKMVGEKKAAPVKK